MKNKKRFIAGMITLTMVSAMAPLNAFATENTKTIDANTSSNSTDVKYSVDPSYTVVIPASITLSDTAATSTSISVDETAKPFKLAKGQKLSVNIADVEINDFKVKCGTVEVPYTVTAGTSTTALEKGSTAAAFTNDDKTAKTLTFSKIDSTLATVAGEYTGTLTFGISVEEPEPPYKYISGQSVFYSQIAVGDTFEAGVKIRQDSGQMWSYEVYVDGAYIGEYLDDWADVCPAYTTTGSVKVSKIEEGYMLYLESYTPTT
ncbi:hypothetical protein RASY3_03090 [Ruminococcus albus SY3]|uniref:Uncharacterized protein n=1 Tax=Ruminococcus albus SY3 TaxID=1341156 RepID=A0A011VTU9_RUMAL|nr:hypothetical protein [Ruminococcus albus]EXM38686.1 hypothetical protein RASY3_18355 [Ruminococcus albus SY3]EXM41040.1 hypothetical protein RASY3_03090 [Ruminococcus albus SY3]